MAVGTVWSDLHYSLETGADGNIRKAVNVEAVKTSIDNILRTNPGERVMLPEFGAGIRGILFENMNKNLSSELIQKVQSAIEKWEPRVKLQAVNIWLDSDEHTVRVEVKYSIIGYDEIFDYSLKV